MKNPIAPFSPVHFAGCVLTAASGYVVYACAMRHSWRGALVAIGLGTLGGLCLAIAPSPFVIPNPKSKAAS